MATAHLDDTQLRALVNACCDKRLFRVADVVKATGVNQGNFSAWKGGNNSQAAPTAAARRFCNDFFATRPLPTTFSRPVAKKPLPPPAPKVSRVPAPATKRVETPPVTIESPASPACPTSHVVVATWNVKNLGASTPFERRARIATLLAAYDIVALQEIRSIDFAAILEATSLLGDYGVVQLAPSGTAARRESTCFVYRRSLVCLVSARSLVELNCHYSPAYAVFSVKAAATAPPLHMVSVHASFSLTPAERTLELAAVLAHAERVVPPAVAAADILVVGDFNCAPKDMAEWTRSTRSFRSVLSGRESTTIGGGCYDSIWAPNGSARVDWSSARVVSLDDMLDAHSRASRRHFSAHISDHLPVTATLVYGDDGT